MKLIITFIAALVLLTAAPVWAQDDGSTVTAERGRPVNLTVSEDGWTLRATLQHTIEETSGEWVVGETVEFELYDCRERELAELRWRMKNADGRDPIPLGQASNCRVEYRLVEPGEHQLEVRAQYNVLNDDGSTTRTQTRTSYPYHFPVADDGMSSVQKQLVGVGVGILAGVAINAIDKDGGDGFDNKLAWPGIGGFLGFAFTLDW